LWHFDETSGNLAADSSSNNITATVNSGTISNGRFNNGISLAGAYSSNIEAGYNSVMNNITTGLSIEFWIKKRLGDSGGAAVNRWHWTDKSWYSGVSTQNEISFAVADSSFAPNISGHTASVTLFTIPDNEWSYVAITFSNGVYKGYLNGVLQTSGTLTITSLGDSTLPILIGKQGDTCCDDHLQATIDEVRISNVARTSSEISAITSTTTFHTKSVDL
jgi:hypothetical protein